MNLLFAIVGAVTALAAIGYCTGAILAVRRPVSAGDDDRALAAGPVSILKPLCGEEPGLYESLRGFFLLDYPDYQIVFGARRADDPALDVVAQLIREFPDADVAVVCDGRVHGANLKVSNLINMSPHARHPVWVLSDSDIRVAPDYLRQVLSPLGQPRVGVVTALYHAEPYYGGTVCALAGLYLDDWFLPSVLVARWIGKSDFCLGATIAVRRDVVESLGGFHALKDYLADDYMLGLLASRNGYQVAMAPRPVVTTVTERTFRALLDHELRWARTIRAVEPLSFFLSCLQHTISVSLIAAALLALGGAGVALWSGVIAVATGLRIMLHDQVARRLGRSGATRWLVPVRDFLSFGVWLGSYFGQSVEWRGRRARVDGRGRLSRALEEGAHEDAVS